MHLKTLLISTLLSSIPVIRAATSIADVNAANQALAKQADDNDAAVQQLNAVNVVTNGKTVSNELAAFAQAVQTAYENDQSANAVMGDDQEQTLCTNTAQYMTDLASKRTVLTTQRANILASLESLSAYFNNLSGVIEGLLPDGDYKAEEATAHNDAQEKINEAVTTYQSTAV